MPSKKAYIQRLSKALMRETPNLEEALQVLKDVAAESAWRHKGTAYGRAYRNSEGRLDRLAGDVADMLMEAEKERIEVG